MANVAKKVFKTNNNECVELVQNGIQNIGLAKNTCSKSEIQKMCYVFKVNNKDTRTL